MQRLLCDNEQKIDLKNINSKNKFKSILPAHEPILRMIIRSSDERIAKERRDYTQANADKKNWGELAVYF